MKRFILASLLTLSTYNIIIDNAMIDTSNMFKGDLIRSEEKDFYNDLKKNIKNYDDIQEVNKIFKQIKKEEQEKRRKLEEERKKKELLRQKQKVIKVETTGYCNCTICSDNWGSKTAMGTRTRDGVIAMPQSIPLGTKVVINGKTYTVEDRGGAVIQNGDTYIVDVWYPNHSSAKKHGRQYTTAYIVNGRIENGEFIKE